MEFEFLNKCLVLFFLVLIFTRKFVKNNIYKKKLNFNFNFTNLLKRTNVMLIFEIIFQINIVL